MLSGRARIVILQSRTDTNSLDVITPAPAESTLEVDLILNFSVSNIAKGLNFRILVPSLLPPHPGESKIIHLLEQTVPFLSGIPISECIYDRALSRGYEMDGTWVHPSTSLQWQQPAVDRYSPIKSIRKVQTNPSDKDCDILLGLKKVQSLWHFAVVSASYEIHTEI